MVSTTASCPVISSSPARQETAVAIDPRVRRDTTYYLANIGKVSSIADFVGNHRLFSYAMKAYGLEDMDYAKGLMTKVLQGGGTNPAALAMRLNDPRYLAFAAAFDFVGKGDLATRSWAATTGATSKYLARALEDDDGQETDGLGLSLQLSEV